MDLINKKVELLAPAGDMECVRVALGAGADAVYMGGAKYGARAFAKSVEEDSIIDAINVTHAAGKKLYITINTLFKQKELKEIFLFLDPIVDAGVDALIIQDLGVGEFIKRHYASSDGNLPFELHASTQMTITSSKGINLVKKLGYKQVVLARELSLKEIKAIKKEIGDDIRLEAFIHGSMCYSYSGACLMSSFIGGESGNRGRCKGPCRLEYRSNVVNKNEKYLLSMKDMCAIKEIKALIDVGISSFKIEGRMRKPEYVEGVVKTYRSYIDRLSDAIDEKNISDDMAYLLSLYNKGGFTNYYDKHNEASMIQRYER